MSLASGLAMVTLLALGASSAHALFGDRYGSAPINGHPEAIQPAPAIPGPYAFWAGACDRSEVPGFPADLAAIGNGTGFGVRSSTILATAGKAVLPSLSPPINAQVQAPAPPLAEHCIDWGAPTIYGYKDILASGQGKIWQGLPYETGLPHPNGGEIGQLGPAGDYAPAWRLPAVTQAGAHPDGTTMFAWNRNDEFAPGSVDGSVDNIYVDLPPGFVGNPQAVPYCTNDQFAEKPLRCPPESQVGILRLNLQALGEGTPSNLPNMYDTTYPVYNLEPRKGRVAELGFGYAADFAAVRLVADARTNGDFGVTAFTGQIPAALTPIAQEITLWGVPWAPENDLWRAKLGHVEDSPTGTGCRLTTGLTSSPDKVEIIPPNGLPGASCQASYQPTWGPIRPFFSAQTECDGSNVTVTMRTDSYQNPGSFTAEGDPDPTDEDWKTYTSASPPVTGCETVPFDAEAEFSPTSSSADGATGLEVDITIPQNNAPPVGLTAGEAADYWRSDAGLATSHLDKTVVTLPDGLTINPSAAAGLEACSNEQMGVRAVGNPYLFDNAEPTCPDGSKIGTVEAVTPLLDEPLSGEMYLGVPESTNPQSGQMFRLFLVLRNKERGLLVKLFGASTADGAIREGGSGRLTATFDRNPRVPVENIKVSLVGGPRGVLALPARCGPHTTLSVFTPWSGNDAVSRPSSFDVDGNCGFGFSPGVQAGSSSSAARGRGSFSLRMTRAEGEQTVSGLTVRMPQGLLASVRGVALCSNADGDSGGCSDGSRIGLVDSAAGSGTPFVLERKGSVYLTEGYKGAPYGLSIVVPIEAGPFRGPLALETLVVRAAVHVDRRTAEVSVVSDPLPQIWHGVPLRVREIAALIDRPRFMLNPSDCSQKQVVADVASPQGAAASPAAGFQVNDCARLGFKPKLALRLTGKKQVTTGKHPGIRAQVTQQGVPEAGIEKAVVRLPKSLALDVNNAQALCEFVDGTKPDLENHCPKGSIVGRARAVSPLLNDPLVGNVYFVKNVRIDPKTGNQIRTLPMIIVALRGEIAINLRGESDTTKAGRLVNTFNGIPDAPVSQFNLTIHGSSKGIIAVTRTRRSLINLCAGRHVAQAAMNGQNGRRRDVDVRMKTPCTKRQTKAARRNARRAAKRGAG